MCHHYTIEDGPKLLEEAGFVVEVFEDGSWDVRAPDDAWPRQSRPVIVQAEQRTMTRMRWGVWPVYEPALPSRPLVNARDDALLTKSVWKNSARTRRCLVPADGFYAWTGPERARTEVKFTLSEHRPFFFAGVWSNDPRDGGRGFAIVTCQPNELVAPLPYDRMPVILERDAARRWLGREPLPDEALLGLCVPYPANRMVRDNAPPPPPRAPAKAKIAKQDLAAPGGELELF